jgi:hypothetical protein
VYFKLDQPVPEAVLMLHADSDSWEYASVASCCDPILCDLILNVKDFAAGCTKANTSRKESPRKTEYRLLGG